jgi:hypothetical protein
LVGRDRCSYVRRADDRRFDQGYEVVSAHGGAGPRRSTRCGSHCGFGGAAGRYEQPDVDDQSQEKERDDKSDRSFDQRRPPL